MTPPLGSSRPARGLIHEDTLPFASETERFDLPFARQCFSTLFDRAAQAVFRLGYDLDDVIVDQFIVQRNPDGSESEMELSVWSRNVTRRNEDQVVGLRIRVYLERSG